MKLKITIDGKTYEVEVEIEEQEAARPTIPYAAPSAQVPAMPPAAAPGPAMPTPSPAGAAGEKVCRSPIVGIVVSVNIQAGQEVKTDDALIVLEAMKMETNITSPFSGKVKAVLVNAGDTVQAGQVLIEFE